MGLVISAAIVPAFNQTIWTGDDPRAILDRWGKAAALLGLGAIADGLVLLAFNYAVDWLLIPLALVSAIGVLVLLTAVYTMVWVMLLRKENALNSLRPLIPILVAGFATGMLQIALLDIVRFWLTGTWGGLTIG
jgi:hypothetical protein